MVIQFFTHQQNIFEKKKLNFFKNFFLDIDKISNRSESPMNLNNQISNARFTNSTARPIPADQLKCNLLKEKISSDKKNPMKLDLSKATFVSVVSIALKNIIFC